MIEDPDEGPTFWISLAVSQWKLGRLVPEVRARALNTIDKGMGLEIWGEDPKMLQKRVAVLAKAREKILSPQPSAKKVPQRFRSENDWPIGGIVSYRLLSGRFCLFRVIGHFSDKGGTYPVAELLDWVGESLPSALQMRHLTIKVEANARKISQFMIGGTSAKHYPSDRVEVLGVKLRPCQKQGRFTVFLWTHLDRTLNEIFGLT